MVRKICGGLKHPDESSTKWERPGWVMIPKNQCSTNDANTDRLPNEIEREKALEKEQFFTTAELATITVLADIIIPKDEKSGSASDAGVPAFIEFIVKDMPDHQVPMRGGLRWLDITCLKRYEKSFVDCSKEQQMQLIDEIAYPTLAKPEMQQGV